MDLRKLLGQIYSAMQRLIAPRLRYSQYLYEDVLREYATPETKWLDLGCGHQILPTWRGQQERELVTRCRLIIGLDSDLESLRKHRTISLLVAGSAHQLPLKSNSLDLVTTNMVVEHLDDPERQFQEVSRVLRPGGIFLFHTPNKWAYKTIASMLIPQIIKGKLVYFLEGRKEEDVYPTYYRANTRKKIGVLAVKCRFRVKKLKTIVSSAELAIVPPLAFFELLWIRLLMTKPFAPLRTNIIAALEKEGEVEETK